MRTVHDLAVASSRARCVGNMGRTRSAGAGEWGGSGGRVRAAGVEGQVLQTVFVLGGKSMKIMEIRRCIYLVFLLGILSSHTWGMIPISCLLCFQRPKGS